MFTIVEETESEENEEETDSGLSRWGWASTIFEMCNGDITKLDLVTERGIIEVLNWLSYHKEKENIINKQRNKWQR